MTLMLASVVDAAEAELALKGGADIIDFADPRRGALGAVPIEAVAKGAEAIGRRRRVSAAIGDPPYEPGGLSARADALAKAGADILRLEALTRKVDLVAVLIADQAPDFDLIPRLASIGFKGALLEAAEKSGNRLL